MVRTIKLDVVSDLICPWCYIGHRQLEAAISLAHSKNLPVRFEIQYHPYILNPSLSTQQPMLKDTYYLNKFGPEKSKSMQEMMSARARNWGIELSFTGLIRQTTPAHRLLLLAYRTAGQRLQLPLLLLIFKAYFELGLDIGDPALLATLAVQAGVFPAALAASPNAINDTGNVKEVSPGLDMNMDKERAKELAIEWIKGKALEEEVMQISTAAGKKGISGVPFTIIDRKWAVSGGQEPDVFLKIFQTIVMTYGENDDPVTGPNSTAGIAAQAQATEKKAVEGGAESYKTGASLNVPVSAANGNGVGNVVGGNGIGNGQEHHTDLTAPCPDGVCQRVEVNVTEDRCVVEAPAVNV